MGILTNLVNSLASEILDFGFGQLDAYVTRELQEGRTENAFIAADAWENDKIQQIAQANQGAGILPIGGTNYQMQIPESMGLSPQPATSPLDLIPGDKAMGQIQQSPLAAEMVRSRYQQLIQQDPYFIQQEAQRKQQESMQDLNKQLGFETFKQNQGGTQTARDIFGGGDITQEQRNLVSGQQIGGLEDAKAQARERAAARKAQLKPPMKSPGATTTRIAEAQGQEIVSAVTDTDVRRIEKTLFSMPLYSVEGPNGKALNQEGQQILLMATDILATQKKKNPVKATMQAVQKYRQSMSQMPQKPAKLPAGQPQKPAAPVSQPKATPQQKASQTTGGSYNKSTAADIERMKTDLKWDNAKIRQFLLDKKIDPTIYGY
ncbi:MAG: hypothetical protein C4555_03270 [Dehalococcoidia bacterium]|nr:MAG: hypothetical protein C4555_03270 [Dehalococcoidia bacterium]